MEEILEEKSIAKCLTFFMCFDDRWFTPHLVGLTVGSNRPSQMMCYIKCKIGKETHLSPFFFDVILVRIFLDPVNNLLVKI